MPAWWTSQEFQVLIAAIGAFGTLLTFVVAAIALFHLRIASRALAAAQEQLSAARDAVEVARQDVRVRCQREAASLAAERCERFANETLPRAQRLLNEVQGFGVDLKQWESLPPRLDDPTFLRRAEVAAWLTSVEANMCAVPPMTEVLNTLESFAIYFTSGAADEQIAYPAVGAIYCKWIEQFAPHLVAVRSKQVKGFTSGPYKHAVELYETWSCRSRRESLTDVKAKTDAALRDTPDRRIPPVGV